MRNDYYHWIIKKMNQNPTSSNTNHYAFSLVALTTLFFLWGFITCLNDILIPHLKNVFSLNYAQAMLIQFCFFGAYFLVSIPAGLLVKRLGYKYGIVVGLFIAGVGCLVFYPAASLRSYPAFLAALFVLASGVTVLQVAANPYVTILGKPETASSRLTLTQAFNAAGTTVAPFFGAALILSFATAEALEVTQMSAGQLEAFRQVEAEAVQIPYLILASVLLFLAAIFAALRLPVVDVKEGQSAAAEKQGENVRSAWSHRHLVLGVLCIFLYVGAEVSIGSFLISFLGDENIAGLEEADAAGYIAYYWGGAMVGRFIGAAVMQKIAAGKVLAFNAAAAFILLACAILGSGNFAMWAILLVGLCNSIMFPTIFSLGVARLGESTSQGSGALCLAIVGGAILPLLQGFFADRVGVQIAFLLPLLCYIYIAFYGLKGSQQPINTLL